MLRTLLLSAGLAFIALAFPQPARGEEFKQAIGPRDWSFPSDHGRHDGFKTEWWYFTGNLHAADGRPFGFQLTFFRTSLAAASAPRSSPWGTRDLYFAHAHVSDIQNQKYLVADRTSRAREGLAMASDHDLDVVLQDWSVRRNQDGVIHLVCHAGDFAFELACTSQRPVLLEGPGGLSQKGAEPGQASYYYSLTRLKTDGLLTLHGQALHVDGLSWMDHEFSSNQLSKQQVGWDWVSLQMNDGSDLMLYRMRNENGATDFSFGTQVNADGSVHYLGADQFTLVGSSPWKSPRSNGVYPQRWRIDLPGRSFDLVTRYPDQEMHSEQSTHITYYEGAAQALDPSSGHQLGSGYLEMTGYGGSLAGSF